MADMLMTDAVEHLSPVWTHLTDILVDHAEGSYLYATDGRKVLDFTSGIGVTNTGHCHPKVVEAIRDQAGKLLHGQANIVYHQPMLRLVDELRTVVPDPLDTFFFSNSGAEAIEASLKLARHATGRQNVIVFQGSFHGRTVGTMSLTTSKTVYRVGYQPLMSGVFVAPFPYSYHYGWSQEQTTEFCLKEIRHLLMTQTAPRETAALLIESVLGEGGYVPATTEFMQGLRQICDEHGILLIVDEVQAGFGRTGKWFGFQHYDITPDIMVMAKGLASGLPLSGIAARKELMDKWEPGTHGGTYGGNAIACAAAAATVKAMKDEKMIENASAMGERLMDGLGELKARHKSIGEVRGLGLMLGTEFTGDHDGKTIATAVQKACLDDNLLLLTCGAYGNTIRWIPPINVSEAEIDSALHTFSRALEKVGA
jgi:4-aminobutyrate aminotransferase